MLQELYETVPEIQAEFANFKVLLLHTTDPFNLFTTKKPVRNQADIKGMKIRELAGPPSEMLKLLGANPMLIPMPGCYEAAEKGVIDGQTASWSAVSGFKLYEPYNYWTDVSTTVAGFVIAMNKETWNSLPPDIQEAIMSVCGMSGAEAVGDSSWGFTLKDDVLAKMEKEGQTMERLELDPGEFERWKEIAGQPLWNKWVSDMEAKGLPGQKVMDEALRLIEKYK